MESGIMELVVKYIPGVKANEMRIQQIINTHCQKYDLSYHLVRKHLQLKL